MRVLVLFLVVVAAFLFLLRFYPSGTVAGAGEGREQASPAEDPGVPEAQAGVRFLSRSGEASPRPGEADGGAPAAAERGLRAAPPPAVVEDAGREPSDDVPVWMEDLVAATPVDLERERMETRLAEALLHGAPAEIERLLAQGEGELPAERRHLVLAFAEALAGRRERALGHAREIGGDAEWRGGEKERLSAALTGRATAVPRPASARAEGPLALAMEMALAEREARSLLAAGDHAAAAGLYSELLLAELDAPWETDHGALAEWSEGLEETQRHHRWDPDGDWPAVDVEVRSGDSLTRICERYLQGHPDHLVSPGLIARANDLEGYLQPGQALRIPTDPVRVVVDLGARRLLYLFDDEVACTWEVGVGREGEETKVGRFTAGEGQKNPSWFPRGKQMVPFGHPDNPLGTRWIAWREDEDRTSYGFHGTNEPESIGRAASDGCVRMRNEDVELLFEILPKGAPILVRE